MRGCSWTWTAAKDGARLPVLESMLFNLSSPPQSSLSPRPSAHPSASVGLPDMTHADQNSPCARGGQILAAIVAHIRHIRFASLLSIRRAISTIPNRPLRQNTSNRPFRHFANRAPQQKPRKRCFQAACVPPPSSRVNRIYPSTRALSESSPENVKISSHPGTRHPSHRAQTNPAGLWVTCPRHPARKVYYSQPGRLHLRDRSCGYPRDNRVGIRYAIHPEFHVPVRDPTHA